METPKTCPYCGEKETRAAKLGNKKEWSVVCRRCKARGPVKESEEEAVKAWNERNRSYDGIPVPPGFTIRECMENKGMSLAAFAENVNMTEEDASAMLKGEMPVDESLACRLEELFGPSFIFWLNLETGFRHALWEYWQATERDEWKQ